MTESARTLESLELVGGRLCLDFANTINSRIYPEHDYVVEYLDLVGWASKVQLLSPAQTNRLQKDTKQQTENAGHAIQTARTIRKAIYSIFSSIAKGAQPTQEDLDFLLQLYGEALSHGRLQKVKEHYTITWKVDEALDALLWPIVHSARELLLSEELAHVKECPGCGWLFLDGSKNQSRRWCSMNTCGARDKMRRYHKRQRAK